MRLVPPWKNSTFWIVPSESSAVAATVMFAGALKLAPLVGLVMLTVGSALATMVTLTGAEVVVAFRLSVATAVTL
jgi:hypothetical protein